MRVQVPNERFKNVKIGGGIRDIVDLANKLAAEGREIYHLEIGSPDFDSPAVAKEAAKKALDAGLVHYADMRGVLELREALAEKLKRENGIEATPANILVTAGAQAAITAVMLSCLNAGDEVIVQTPCFGAYVTLCGMIGTKLVPAFCDPGRGFEMDTDELASKVTERTKMIVLNSPNNPSGGVLSRGTLERIAEIAQRNDLLVLSDECYERFLYDGRTHTSIASLPGMAQRTTTVGSASKTYSMTGWRVGYLVMPDRLVPYANRMHLVMNTCTATFNQYGYLEALKSGEDDVVGMIAEYEKRRDLVCDWLGRMPKIDFRVPEGAFYVFPRIEKSGMSATEFCGYMLNEAGVALVPGEAFEAPGFVRLTYCKSRDYLTAAMASMKSAMEKL